MFYLPGSHPKHRAVASVPAAAAAPPDDNNAKDNNNGNDDDNGNNNMDLPRDNNKTEFAKDNNNDHDDDNGKDNVDLPRYDNKMELPLPGRLVIDIAGIAPVIVGANAESTMCTVVKFSMLT
jgi:hypothetical protein